MHPVRGSRGSRTAQPAEEMALGDLTAASSYLHGGD